MLVMEMLTPMLVVMMVAVNVFAVTLVVAL